MHHKSIIYNKPTRCNSGSIVFINNYKYALHVSVFVHHKSIIYNKPARCNSGSIVFINNYKYALHVSDALCVHHQEHYKHQWLLLQFIVLLMMDAKGVRIM